MTEQEFKTHIDFIEQETKLFLKDIENLKDEDKKLTKLRIDRFIHTVKTFYKLED